MNNCGEFTPDISEVGSLRYDRKVAFKLGRYLVKGFPREN
jgi:hypothetical protein